MNKHYNIQSFIENKFGYNRITELLNALTTIILNPLVFIKLLSSITLNKLRNKKTIVFSFAMPSYSDNVQNVPFILKKKGYNVLIFPEWVTEKFPNYKLKNEYQELDVYYDLWYMLPFLSADILFTPTARKHIYFPLGAKKINCFHSLASINAFPEDGFISYDIFFSSGPHQTIELKEYCSRYNLNNRIIINAGYPKVDFMYQQSKKLNLDSYFKNKNKTILYTPTYWSGNKNDIFSECSTVNDSLLIIRELIKEYNVIFRPHPLNLKHNNIVDVLKSLEVLVGKNSNLYLDFEKSSEKSSFISDIMISDVSGTAFTYALSFEKPVLFIDKGIIGEGLQFTKRESIGIVMPYKQINNINSNIGKLLKNSKSLLKVDEIIFNFLNAEDNYVLNLEKIINNKYDKKWEHIN
jgi:hypothetical protein